MLGRCGTGSVDCASAAIPRTKAGLVTRSSIVLGLWQSTQLTGWTGPACAASACFVLGVATVAEVATELEVRISSACASEYFIALTSSNPFITAGQANS